MISLWILGINLSIHAQNMNTMKEQETRIRERIENYYFKGIYEGNIGLLQDVFEEHTLLFGDINGVPYKKTVQEYLLGVQGRVSPKDSGKPFKAEIISIAVINTIATAKLHVQMYDANYYNFMNLHLINGRWVIISKTLTDVPL